MENLIAFAAKSYAHNVPVVTIGLDLGDRHTHFCVLDQAGDVVERGRVATKRSDLGKLLSRLPSARVVVEAGTHSPWVSRLIREYDSEAVVANPRNVALIYKSRKKTDRIDAEKLARLGRLDLRLLAPIQHRGEAVQLARAHVKARDLLVRQRAGAVAMIRGTVKSAYGDRLPACETDKFHELQERLPELLRAALSPVMTVIESMTEQIAELDDLIEQLATEVFPETKYLTQVYGVGTLTALTYVLTIEDPARFDKSRRVGSYVGLTQALDQSGTIDNPCGISRAGDELLRRLLVQCAHTIMRSNAPDSDLRRWGIKLMARGGRAARQKAVVAVARKLSVLMHALWSRRAKYEPLRDTPAPDLAASA